ncbi:hypothetical protein KCP70_21270 [Salmonella enterica subsp. enterica]|nr:hypothetical protein KCP70_21270 [Salmonella enterica subsp. enterica]
MRQALSGDWRITGARTKATQVAIPLGSFIQHFKAAHGKIGIRRWEFSMISPEFRRQHPPRGATVLPSSVKAHVKRFYFFRIVLLTTQGALREMLPAGIFR